MDREAIEEAIEVLEDASAEMLTETGDENYYGEAITSLRRALETEREWVGLTDEERHSIREWQEIQKELGPVWAPMMLYLYEAIEAKLKEKNT